MSPLICLWSGPRNVSTALMYSFAQQADVRVVDEPLYGHYLRASGAEHPGRDDIIAAMNCNGDAVMAELLRQQSENPSQRMFVKHMAHHLVQLDLRFLQLTKNVFLIRDPVEMLPSLNIQLPHATLVDTGLKRQWDLFRELSDAGQRPAVLDSRELLLAPEAVLRQLCAHLDMTFDRAMLSWQAGPRPEDGIWAPHWYHAVHKSTGFSSYQPKTGFPDELRPLLERCQPWYDRLYEHAITASEPGDTI